MKKRISSIKILVCRNYGLSLPLISLQYHEVKLTVKLSSFNECWKKEFSSYYLIKREMK